jgi:hypothetical protein
LLSAGVLPGAGARAQIVNVERLLPGEPQPGLEGALHLSLNIRQGNSESRGIDGNALVRVRMADHLLQVVAGGTYETAQGNRVADQTLAHLRYGFLLPGGGRLEALAQVQRNAFVRLRRRVLLGGGIRLPLIHPGPADRESGRGTVDIGLVVMHEREELNGFDSEPGWRGSVLLSARWAFADNASAGGQIYYQPLLNRPNDARLLGDAGVTIRLLGPLSLMVEFRLVHDSDPPPGVKTTDFSLRNTLAVTF